MQLGTKKFNHKSNLL